MKPPLKNEIRKPTKTISGITPVAVMLSPRKCKHGACVYCPSLNVPQSYTPKSPVVMRAKEVGYDAYKQVVARIRAFEAMNHPTDKIELIIMGGTFLEYPTRFQEEFVKGCYDGLNGIKSKSLENAQKKNETAKHRCVALCIETRPDRCSDEDIKKMRGWGATRVELGVQIIDDKIYNKINRGHNVGDVVDATKRLKDAGFKIGYHIMPGLPGSNPKKDLQLFKKLFSDEKFKPDQLKIYPCTVMPGSELEKIYWKGKYKPYNKEQIEKLLIQMLKAVPRYCRVMRVMREIHPDYIVAGTTKIDLRRDVEDVLRKNKIKLQEIRYREIGFNLSSGKPKLKITKYKASKGEEYFLEFVDNNDTLYGLLRLRIFDESLSTIPPAHPKGKVVNIKISEQGSTYCSFKKNAGLNKLASKNISLTKNKNAIIREIHVYGRALKLGEQGKIGQHIGLGKLLMKKAEEIVNKSGCREIKVISGVGVREYYKKLGYVLGGKEDGNYMIRDIKI